MCGLLCDIEYSPSTTVCDVVPYAMANISSVSVAVCKIQARMWTEWNPALYIASGYHWKPRFCHNVSLTQGLPVYV